MNFYPVFVNHIADSVRPADLRAIFERHGVVTDVIIVAEHGFVNMAAVESAREAVRALNGHGLYNQLLHVDCSEELKVHLRQRGEVPGSSRDPASGWAGGQHPPYPTGPQVDSPWSSREDLGHLVEDQDSLDERLRRVNLELERMKQQEGGGESSWAGSRYRERSRRQSREGRWGSQERDPRSWRSPRRHSREEERWGSPGRSSGRQGEGRDPYRERPYYRAREGERYPDQVDPRGRPRSPEVWGERRVGGGEQ